METRSTQGKPEAAATIATVRGGEKSQGLGLGRPAVTDQGGGSLKGRAQ